MPRYFSLDQALRTLPRVQQAVRDAIEVKAQYQHADDELKDVSRRVMASGGMQLDRGHVGQLRQEREVSAQRLQSALDSIHEYGCLVKDLDIGLLDFPTLYRGREVYLCWRLGEEKIEFWHDVDEGFRGRKPIDDDFLANHKGDSVS
jgi:hypothetical protein